MSSAILATGLTLEADAQVFRPHRTPGGRPRRPGAPDDGYGETAEPDWRAIDWPAHLHQVEIDGTPVNYVDIGSGEREPIVFVHGLGGQWQNWLENIPRAAQERRVIALDLPGFGLLADAARRRSRSRATDAAWTRSASSSGSAAWTSSATRWAATSPPRWRSSSRSGSTS